MPVAYAQNLALQLLDTVPRTLASQIQAYDWQQANVVERGKDHVLVIAEGLAVARIPRRNDPELARKTRLLEELRLPWQVPTPLSSVDGGVLQAYIPGSAHPHHSGNATTLATVVQTLERYDTSGLSLGQPFAQRGRITDEMLVRLDSAVEHDMHRAIAEHIHAWTDEGVGAGLVHGDLAGHNMHWVDGELIGILDWDYAAVWDTALNATYLNLWHGVALEEFSAVPNRARVWSGALGLYSLADALSWDVSPGGWRRLNAKVQPRIQRAYQALQYAED
ncbi:phosphotransferase [Yaniella halotolerans]|uniref:phosphotransferase n=1 Tax=Yaniella halotolerans TaxID=225453 RepID=UPI0003B5B885|nr:phosphotransferase [Yaniella halotolerans]